MIFYFTPYSSKKDIGEAYNACMSLIDEEDSACLMDGDTMFLTSDFGSIIDDYAAKYPHAVLTCKTNRIHRLSKQLDGDMDEQCNIRDLIKKAEVRKQLRTVTEIKWGEGMSGVLMVVPKKIWRDIPFKQGLGLLGVDSEFRKDLHNAGVPILIMDGLFIFHQYRLLNGAQYKSHLTS